MKMCCAELRRQCLTHCDDTLLNTWTSIIFAIGEALVVIRSFTETLLFLHLSANKQKHIQARTHTCTHTYIQIPNNQRSDDDITSFQHASMPIQFSHSSFGLCPGLICWAAHGIPYGADFKPSSNLRLVRRESTPSTSSPY